MMKFAVAILLVVVILLIAGTVFTVVIQFLISLAEDLHLDEWIDAKARRAAERIKKDAYDHFFPNGRWFGLEDVIAWMPMPEPYKEDNDG